MDEVKKKSPNSKIHNYLKKNCNTKLNEKNFRKTLAHLWANVYTCYRRSLRVRGEGG